MQMPLHRCAIGVVCARIPAWRCAVLIVVTATLLAACGGATGSPAIAVSDVRAPAPAGPNGAVYLTVRNDGDGADRLVSATSDVADGVEIHESTMAEGTMSMRRVDGVDIPAGGEAVLEPGGYHIMLIDVREDVAEGDTFDLTLSFEISDDRTVKAEVVPLVP